MARKRVIFGVVALVACLVLAAVLTLIARRSRIERPKVLAAYEQLRLACEAKHFDEGYLMMTRGYRKRVSLEDFRKDCADAMLGADETGWVVFGRCKAWSESGPLVVGYIWTFRKEDGVWRCDGHGDRWYVD